MGVAFYGINWLCWTFGKYLIINVNEQNQEDVVTMEDNENFQWKGLEDNEIITLTPPSLRNGRPCFPPEFPNYDD